MDFDSRESLRNVLLHDLRLFWGGWTFDARQKRFSLDAWDLDESLSRFNRVLWWVQKKTTPWRKFQLVFNCVSACNVEVTEKPDNIDFFTLSTLEYDWTNKRVLINTNYILSFVLEVTDVTGSFVATSQVSWDRPSRSFVLRVR